MNLRSLYLRDTYVNALSKALNVSTAIQDLNLRNVGLTNLQALSLIPTLRNERLKSLDLSYNPNLTKTFYQQFSDSFLGDERTTLSRLILEGNKLGDSVTQLVCKGLMAIKPSLIVLNLSKNEITDLGLSYICEFLTDNDTISCLLLHWNRLTHIGGDRLSKVLVDPKCGIQILDISYNSIGTDHNPKAKSNTTLNLSNTKREDIVNSPA